MNGFQGVDLDFFHFQQMVVELKHIRILDPCQFFLAKGFPDESVIHIEVVALGGLA